MRCVSDVTSAVSGSGVRRKRKSDAIPSPVALVAAGFDDIALRLTLTFDRAVDASGLVGNAVVVDDPVGTGMRYEAIGAVTVLTPASFEVGMTDVQGATGTGVRLTAGPANGIVAADGGAVWAGVTGLELPFP